MERLSKFKTKYPYLYYSLSLGSKQLGTIVMLIMATFGIAYEVPKYLTWLVAHYGPLGQVAGVLSLLLMLYWIADIFLIPVLKLGSKTPNGQETS